MEAKIAKCTSLIDEKYGLRLKELLQNAPQGVTIDVFIDTYFKAYQEELPYKYVEAPCFVFECVGTLVFYSVFGTVFR